MQHSVRVIAATAGLTLLLAGCSATPDTSSEVGTQGPTALSPAAALDPAGTSAEGSAAKALKGLKVKGRAPKTGYSREQFGSAWSDVDGNGCDTRNDILTRDLVERQMGDDNCTVLSGVLYPDPYTAGNIVYVRGKSLIDIDHVVALGNAWVTGAAQWTASKRLAVANDPLNLLAVSASANRQKGDGDAATWLPSNKAYRCSYVARQIAVKAKYELWVTPAEKTTMLDVLSACPGQKLPDGRNAVPVPTDPGGGGGESGDPGSDNGTRYASCADAKSAGVTPIYKSKTPKRYAANAHLDRDKDGVACES